MLSSKLSVGVHVLSLLAAMREEPLTSEFIAGSVNTNPVVIRRLLGLLRKAGHVESRGGVGGGWVLARDPGDITLLDILEAVETEPEPFGMHASQPNPRCPVGRNIQHVLRNIYRKAESAMGRELKRVTVGAVLRSVKAREEA